jgi:UDP-N-acetylglucosamine 1-carboxyvinyltransferase
MDKIRIQGGRRLGGRIQIEGAKNAALPIMAACLLASQPVTLSNVPRLQDIETMGRLLDHLGTQCTWEPQKPGVLSIQSYKPPTLTAPYDIVRKMRASILVLGPLLARWGEAVVSLPGGCAIGTRPVDIHMRGLQALGAEVSLENGYIHATAPRGLQGGVFTFPKISVTGTENLLLAAVLARGETQLLHAAREPEVGDLAHFLNSLGAKIEGIGTDTLSIQGVGQLEGGPYSIMPDRIETGTYAMAAAITGGDVLLTHTSLALLPSVSSVLAQAGVVLQETPDGLRVSSDGPQSLRGLDIITEPFPGFATDLQAQLMALFSLASGASLLTETIFENRFMHVAELLRMGADITIQGHTALIRGVPALRGAPVMATDLRASVSLILAGLAAEGETVVGRIYHLDRGYQELDKKLAACGAQIERLTAENPSPLPEAEETVSELAL